MCIICSSVVNIDSHWYIFIFFDNLVTKGKESSSIGKSYKGTYNKIRECVCDGAERYL